MRLRPRKLGFRSLCFSSSVFPPSANIQPFSGSLFKLHESSIFSAMQLRGGGIKGDEHLHLPRRNSVSTMRPPAHCFASKRSPYFNYTSTPSNPFTLHSIAFPWRRPSLLFSRCESRYYVYLFYSDDGNRLGYRRLEYSRRVHSSLVMLKLSYVTK